MKTVLYRFSVDEYVLPSPDEKHIMVSSPPTMQGGSVSREVDRLRELASMLEAEAKKLERKWLEASERTE